MAISFSVNGSYYLYLDRRQLFPSCRFISLSDSSFTSFVLENMEVQINIAPTVGKTPTELPIDVPALVNETNTGAEGPMNLDFTAENMEVQMTAAPTVGKTLDYLAGAVELIIDVPPLVNETNTGAEGPMNLDFTAENGSSSVGRTPLEASGALGHRAEVSINLQGLTNETDAGAMDSMNFEFAAEYGSSSDGPDGQTPPEASSASGQVHGLGFKEYLHQGLSLDAPKWRAGLGILLTRLQYEQVASLGGLSDPSYTQGAEQVPVNFDRPLTRWLNWIAWTGMLWLNFIAMIIIVWPVSHGALFATIMQVGSGSYYLCALFNVLSGFKVITWGSILPAFLFVLVGSLTFTLIYVLLVFFLLYISWRINFRRM